MERENIKNYVNEVAEIGFGLTTKSLFDYIKRVYNSNSYVNQNVTEKDFTLMVLSKVMNDLIN